MVFQIGKKASHVQYSPDKLLGQSEIRVLVLLCY